LSKTVLIAPLHWGLGHATRCIPIIRQQLEQGNEVIVSAKGGPREIIQAAFPSLQFIDIPFMEITYPRDGNMARHFFWLGPKLIRNIWREHHILQKLVSGQGIDLVISDSRFGLWTKKVKCVFITHQVEIKSPIFQRLINVLNRWVMNQFDEVWIPDYQEKPGLAGELSHPSNLPANAKYIGPLSRFSESVIRKTPIWKAVVIISGPEPQRCLFEADMARRFIKSNEPALILRGKPGSEIEENQIGNLRTVNHLNDKALVQALSETELVIARSGYSTVMDLNALGLSAEWHPTPGQTEQEYLAEIHQNHM
jgi:predicted glycosyltransferase